MKTTVLLLALTLAMTASAFANIAPPNVAMKSIDTELSIRLDRNATEAKLIIPRNQLKQLRAELEQLDIDSDNTAAAASISGGDGAGLKTIVSGSLLSLAFVFAGVWAVRTGRLSTKSGKVAAAGVLMLFAGAFATYVYANAGPPEEARAITGKMFDKSLQMYGFGYGKIKLEVSDNERVPKLIVPNGDKKPASE